jgi:hypothetical protein
MPSQPSSVRVAFAVALALAFAPLAAQDASPPPPAARRLVYELPVDALQRAARGSQQSLEQQLDGLVAALQSRVGDGVAVRRDGATGCVVTVAAERAADLATIRRVIETPGSLELRIVASNASRHGDTAFDLAAERARLRAWLDAGGKARVLADPRALGDFHADAAKGPVAGAKLQWRVHRQRRDPNDATRWQPSFADRPALKDACVRLYGDGEWNGGTVPPARGAKVAPESLVELVAVDCAQRAFTGADVDPEHVGIVATPSGEAAVGYRMREDQRAAYGDWSERNVRCASVVVWCGEVISAPTFLGRIGGNGVITGALGPAEMNELVRCLRTGGEIVPPRFVREEPVPARK